MRKVAEEDVKELSESPLVDLTLNCHLILEGKEDSLFEVRQEDGIPPSKDLASLLLNTSSLCAGGAQGHCRRSPPEVGRVPQGSLRSLVSDCPQDFRHGAIASVHCHHRLVFAVQHENAGQGGDPKTSKGSLLFDSF